MWCAIYNGTNTIQKINSFSCSPGQGSSLLIFLGYYKEVPQKTSSDLITTEKSVLNPTSYHL